MDLQPVNELECSKCPIKFKTYDDLKNHVITHHPDAKVKCKICGQVWKNRRALSAHKRAHHTETERPSCESQVVTSDTSCDTCHQMFPNPTKLRDHMNSVHSTNQRPRFPCTFPGCEKTYQNKGHVLRHVKTDHAENPVRLPCTICRKEFKTRQDLEQHMVTHTTEKPFNCATCGRSFARKGDMKNHEVTHLEESARVVSKCPFCPQTLLSTHSLRYHIRVVHENQKNYTCTFCDKRFSNSSNLNRHVEAIHDTNKELIHSCDKCEYRTNSEADLILHGKRHEPGNDSQES